MKLQLLAIPLLLALLVSPFVASAAAGTVTFTSPTAGSSLTGTASYTISGSITPAPTLPDNVNIAVTNPSGQVVDSQQVAVGAGGVWTPYVTNVGGNPTQWTSGTYTISVVDSDGATGTTTFTYTAIAQTPVGNVINIFVAAATPVYSGQTVDVEAMLVWATNGTLASQTSITAKIWAPNGATTTLAAPLASSTKGQYYFTYAVPAGSADGAYFIQVVAKDGNAVGWGLGSFTVNSQVASASGLTAITNAVTGLGGLGKNITSLNAQIAAVSSAVSGVASSVNTLSTTVSSINSAVSSLSTTVSSLSSTLGTVNTNVQGLGTSVASLSSTVSTISTSVSSLTSSISTLTSDVTSLQATVNGLGNLSGQMTSLQTSVTNLNSSVSNSQTYILVVAALAVITLVLELAILIRKLS